MKITVPSIVQLILVCLVSPSKGPGYISVDINTTDAALYAEPEEIRKKTACGLDDRSSITGTEQICLFIAVFRPALRATQSHIQKDRNMIDIGSVCEYG